MQYQDGMHQPPRWVYWAFLHKKLDHSEIEISSTQATSKVEITKSENNDN